MEEGRRGRDPRMDISFLCFNPTSPPSSPPFQIPPQHRSSILHQPTSTTTTQHPAQSQPRAYTFTKDEEVEEEEEEEFGGEIKKTKRKSPVHRLRSQTGWKEQTFPEDTQQVKWVYQTFLPTTDPQSLLRGEIPTTSTTTAPIPIIPTTATTILPAHLRVITPPISPTPNLNPHPNNPHSISNIVYHNNPLTGMQRKRKMYSIQDEEELEEVVVENDPDAKKKEDCTGSGGGDEDGRRKRKEKGKRKRTGQGGIRNEKGKVAKSTPDGLNKKEREREEEDDENSRAAKRKRKKLSDTQRQILQENFQKDPLPDYVAKQALAESLGLTFKQVDNWFHNRRASVRKWAKQEKIHEK